MELRYLGFDQKRTSRVYSFECMVEGKAPARYAVSVEMDLFLKHRVGIQEGPALCARKLTAGFAADDNAAACHQGDHELTNDDLLAFTGERAAAEARKAESRRPVASRKKPEPGPSDSPWHR